jgi:hypothetical protein
LGVFVDSYMVSPTISAFVCLLTGTVESYYVFNE